MALATTVQKKYARLREIVLKTLITPSGSYATGGDALDFRGLPGWTPEDPIQVDIKGKGGYIYEYDYQNRKMLVRIATTTGANIPLAEHSAAAYAAGVTADVIIAFVTYEK